MECRGGIGTLEFVQSPDSGVGNPTASRVHRDVALVGQAYNRLALSGGWQAFLDECPDPDPRLAAVDELETRIGQGKQVVELGCGTGRPVAERLATFADVTAYDLSVAFIEEAQRSIEGPEFEYGDMATLDLPERSTDAIVAFFSIMHVPRELHADLYRRMRSWLRPRGFVSLALGATSMRADRQDDWLGGGPMFWSSYDSSTNLRLLREAGFAIVNSSVRRLIEPEGSMSVHWALAQRQYG